MARTKPTEALKNILAAERIRLRQLKLNPDFQRALKELESIAKRLAVAPSGRFLDLSQMSEKDLFPTDDETAFHDLAERFKEKWGFQPRWNDEGKVDLFIGMPAGGYKILPGGENIEMTRRGKHHPDGDVDALAKYYRSLRQRLREKRESIRAHMEAHQCDYQTAKDAVERADLKKTPQRRRRLDTDAERLRARELRAQGKTIPRIAQIMYPHKCRALLKRNAEKEQELRPLTAQYMEPPHNLTWPEAEKRAASELGLDMRPPSEKIETLTRKIRRYLLPDK